MDKSGDFTYVIEIVAYLEKHDRGYWSKTPFDEFLSKCDDPKNMQVFIKQGALDPVPVRASIRIKQVIVNV